MIQLQVYAQDPVIDSLKLAFKNAKHDTIKVKLLSQLSEVCETEDILKYAEPCVLISERNISEIVNNNIRLFYYKHLSISLNNIGYFSQIHGEMLKALDYFNKSLKYKLLLNDEKGIASAYNNIGFIYKQTGDITKGLEYFHKSLKIFERINDKYGMALNLNNIGGIYLILGDQQKALMFYNKSLKYREEIGDNIGIALSLNNIGTFYLNQNDNLKALPYFEKALSFSEIENDNEEVAFSLNNIGAIYYKKGDYLKALDYYQRSFKKQEEINEKEGIASSLISISSVMYKLKKVEDAISYAKKSLELAKEMGLPESIRNATKLLKEIYRKESNYKTALEMYELEILMSDSINNEGTRKAAIKKQFQYEYEKQAAADSVKHAEEQKVKNALLVAQSASLKQEKTQRYALYGGLLLVIGFSVFVFNRFRVTQKQKKVIEEQKVLVDAAYEQLHEKNKEVMDSITYARRIQRALITPEIYIDRALNKLNKNS